MCDPEIPELFWISYFHWFVIFLEELALIQFVEFSRISEFFVQVLGSGLTKQPRATVNTFKFAQWND